MKITNMSLVGWVLSVFCLLLGVAFSIFTIHVALAAVTFADIGGCILLGAFSFLTLAAAVGLFKVGLGE